MSYSKSQQLVLATGLQSSGSSLLSWCFLQRQDMNGVLDGDTDIVPVVPPGIETDYIWYKTTISSFTLPEQIVCLEDECCDVKPLLIVRDVRAIWASLARKHYGRNGLTAEDPPLRLRFRRFRDSWEYARKNDIPVVRFEDFLAQPEKTLRECCKQLSLSWDQGMMTWPKPAETIADTGHGNATFRQSSRTDVLSAIGKPSKQQVVGPIHVEDLRWLETYFADFNQHSGYPAHLTGIEQIAGRNIPSWDVSRRKKWRLQQKPIRYLLSKLKLISYDSRPE